MLRRSVRKGTISHAYLFEGPAGVGKFLAATEFVKAARCREGRDADSCGRCAECRKVDHGNHEDVFFLAPLEGKRLIGIKQVQELDRKLFFKAYSGKRKFAVVRDAHAMTEEAMQAFLKTLEEPPEGTTIILVTETAEALLSTIRSRCQRVKFYALAPEVIRSCLARRGDGDESLDFLASFAAGSLGRALAARGGSILQEREALFDLLFLSRDSDATARAEAVFRTIKDYAANDALEASRVEFQQFAEIALTFCRDILAVQSGLPPAAIINRDMADKIREQAGVRGEDELFALGESLREMQRSVAANVGLKLVLLTLMERLTQRESAGAPL